MVGRLICSNRAVKGRAALQAMDQEDDFFVHRKIEKININLETGNEAFGSPCTSRGAPLVIRLF